MVRTFTWLHATTCRFINKRQPARHWARRAGAFLACVLATAPIVGQEASVRPGINDDFRDPKLDQWIGRFEVESREVFEKRQSIVETLKLRPDQVVADIGAGTGLFTRLFAAEIGSQGRVYAVDISQKFLDHIASTSQAAGQTNVETIKADDHSVQLAPGSVDLAFVCDTYHHFEYPHHVLASIHKALRADGRLVVIDFKRVPGESTEWVMNHVRADQATVEHEITEAGFQRVGEHSDILRQNYFLMFHKR